MLTYSESVVAIEVEQSAQDMDHLLFTGQTTSACLRSYRQMQNLINRLVVSERSSLFNFSVPVTRSLLVAENGMEDLAAPAHA